MSYTNSASHIEPMTIQQCHHWFNVNQCPSLYQSQQTNSLTTTLEAFAIESKERNTRDEERQRERDRQREREKERVKESEIWHRAHPCG
ncbi:hypothetical protein Bpfe_019884 [Biomphalaria pfeifferi]|uniref:Uncharacterized protein n=1 Tax=Biomphalaria pfeifferi TaxID=112525 RepID=A0AAD8BC93_BIOPF|nr:hypothetical protein Bpfe_019884 [Biomphalaria pfeifferi]